VIFCGTQVVFVTVRKIKPMMQETIKALLIIEMLLLVNVIMALTLWFFWKKKTEKDTVLNDEKLLNEKAKDLYEKLNNSEPSLSLSLGQEESKNSSCPSFLQFVCEEDDKEWVLTY